VLCQKSIQVFVLEESLLLDNLGVDTRRSNGFNLRHYVVPYAFNSLI
jgi:hypothetical protein